MRWMLVLGLVLCGSAVAATHYSSGFSNEVVTPVESDSQTGWMLKQQAQSTPPKLSELPAQLYVESQKRLADSFQQAIPEKLHTDTRN